MGRRLIVVSGAASGIGLATVRAVLAASSARVVIGVDLDESPPETRNDGDVRWVRGDVASDETWKRVATVCRQYASSGPDCVILCAADIVVAPFLETGVDDWRRLFDVNVIGAVRALQTFLPGMLLEGRGAVAIVCSINSLSVEDRTSAYSTSKAALLQMVRSAALEHARGGVRINAVCPGCIDTPLLRRHFESLDDPAGARRSAERRTPTGRILAPAEVAAALQFLIDDEASGLCGAALVVDGGLTSTFDFDSGPQVGALA